MLCPCCGGDINLDAVECNCGARFVGAPLDEKPVQIKSYGHVMNTFGLLAVMITAALVFTKFFALGALPVIWYTWRSLKLSRNNPEQFGGYTVLAPTFALTLIASFVIAGLTISYIPRFLENRQTRIKATTEAGMRQDAAIIEAYQAANNGTVPRTEQELRNFSKEQLGRDYWGHSIRYVGSIERIATVNNPNNKGSAQAQGLGFYNYELRSNGPDEQPNTDDDIIMKDGVIYTAAELRAQNKTSAK
jgi:hypothetical protein